MARTRKPQTEPTDVLVHVILDRSGSMESIRDATIVGFNEYLAEQALLPGARFSLAQFDSEAVEHLYSSVPVGEVKKLSRHSFVPRGMTPLYDAVGQVVSQLRSDPPTGKVVVVIITDGEENASREYTRAKVFKLVSEQRTAGWEFVFMGANVDAYAAGTSLGINGASTYGYAATPAGTEHAFAAVSQSTTMYRSGRSPTMVMPPTPAEGGRRQARGSAGPLDEIGVTAMDDGFRHIPLTPDQPTAPIGPFRCPACGGWWFGNAHRCPGPNTWPWRPLPPQPIWPWQPVRPCWPWCCGCRGVCMHTGPHTYCPYHTNLG